MTRRTLPNRRRAELVDFWHDGLAFTAGISRYQDGSVAEVFLSCSKIGSNAADLARDAAISASIALQHGCPIATLRHAVTRVSDGRAAGPVGVLLDLLAHDGGANG